MAVHRAGTAMVARTAAVVVLLVTTVTLLPRMGEVGAGIGVLAGSVAGALLLGAAVLRYARSTRSLPDDQPHRATRSEERPVGEEVVSTGRTRWWPDH